MTGARVELPAALRLVIHPGLPKTATTFLQDRLFTPHPAIASLGKPFTPAHRRLRLPHLLRDVARLDDAAWQRERGRIAAALQRLVSGSELVDPGVQRSVVISYENFYHPNRELAPETILGRLEALFGERIHWLFTVRAQPAWLESYYLYTFVDYLEHGGPALDEWVDAERRRAHNPFRYADYAAVLRPLVERVAGERLLIAPMEALLADAGGLATERLPRLLGVDAPRVARLLGTAAPSRERIHAHQLAIGRTVRLAREAGLARPARWLLRVLLARVDRRLLRRGGLAKARAGVDFETLFSATELAALRAGNRWLAEATGCDLAAYGYPLPDDTDRPRAAPPVNR